MTSAYSDENQTIILQVQLGEVREERLDELKYRFSRWLDFHSGLLEYPVTCDSHGFDVFMDEFTGLAVEYAALVLLPFGVEHFTPFTEESSSASLAEYDVKTGEWVTQ